MRVHIEHRQRSAGLLRGVRQVEVIAYVDFSEEEISIITSRQLEDFVVLLRTPDSRLAGRLAPEEVEHWEQDFSLTIRDLIGKTPDRFTLDTPSDAKAYQARLTDPAAAEILPDGQYDTGRSDQPGALTVRGRPNSFLAVLLWLVGWSMAALVILPVAAVIGAGKAVLGLYRFIRGLPAVSAARDRRKSHALYKRACELHSATPAPSPAQFARRRWESGWMNWVVLRRCTAICCRRCRPCTRRRDLPPPRPAGQWHRARRGPTTVTPCRHGS